MSAKKQKVEGKEEAHPSDAYIKSICDKMFVPRFGPNWDAPKVIHPEEGLFHRSLKQFYGPL